MKKPMAILLAWMLVFSVVTATAAAEMLQPSIYVDGSELPLNQQIRVAQDHTLVPLRALSEALGFTVSWNDPVITVKKDATEIVMTMNSDRAVINGKEVACPKAPSELVWGVTYVPVRFLGEALGYSVAFSEESKRIDLTSPVLTQRLMNLMPQDANYMISPLSLEYALSMAANGAEGETKEQILSFLGISDLNSYNNKVKQQIAENSDQVSIANSIWLNTDYFKGYDVSFAPDYQKAMKNFYAAEVGEVTDSTAVEQINSWIYHKTQGKIDRMISDSHFAAALVNTIYLKDRWSCTFSEYATKPGDFTCADGTKVQKDMMHQTNSFYYYDQNGTKAVAMPYQKSGLLMVAALSDSPIDPISCFRDMTYEWVSITLPKFKTEYETDLTNTLSLLGIKRAFTNAAEFSGMLEGSPVPIKIDKVLQKTFIEVDEEGTEAAAATAMIAVGASMSHPKEAKEFTADRPFTYYIIDPEAEQVYFAGAIVQ